MSSFFGILETLQNFNVWPSCLQEELPKNSLIDDNSIFDISENVNTATTRVHFSFIHVVNTSCNPLLQVSTSSKTICHPWGYNLSWYPMYPPPSITSFSPKCTTATVVEVAFAYPQTHPLLAFGLPTHVTLIPFKETALCIWINSFIPIIRNQSFGISLSWILTLHRLFYCIINVCSTFSSDVYDNNQKQYLTFWKEQTITCAYKIYVFKNNSTLIL